MTGIRRPRVQPHQPRRQMPARVYHPDAVPTGLPDTPCFMCGSRGWCEHRPEGSV